MKKQKSYNHRNSPKCHQNSPKKEYISMTSNDLSIDEIEKIRIEFKQKRIRLGLSQKQAAESVSKSVRKTSQTSLCRFENNQLHKKNMISLAPHLKQWIKNQK